MQQHLMAFAQGHHSNNCLANLHDYSTDNICWFPHRTNRGTYVATGKNWWKTSGGTEDDMLRTILKEVKAKGFKVTQIIMDRDTKGGNISCSVFLR